MKTLLFVAPAITYGGAEKNLIGIANYAVSIGYKVYLLTEKNREDSRWIDERIIHIKEDLDYNCSFLQRWIKAIIIVRRTINKYQPDIVISFIELWRSACIIASKFSKTKCIVSERADPYTRGGRHDKLVFGIFKLADGAVFQTENAQNYFGERFKKRSRVIPNPVFPEDMLGHYEGQKKNIIVSLARYDLNQKRQDVAIKAFSRIAQKYSDYSLLLYGSGSDENKIKDIISSLGLQKRVFIMGKTNDIYNDLGEARAMLLTSDFEGIPNAIIESMCLGVPVVSTRCSPGGAELLIQDRVNGLLCKCGDDADVADKIDMLLSDQGLQDSIIKAGYSVVDRFDWRKILQEWIDYIEEI